MRKAKIVARDALERSSCAVMAVDVAEASDLRRRQARDVVEVIRDLAGALGERGLAAYRKAVVQAGNADSFAARYAQQRLAVVDRDIGRIVELLGGEHDLRRQIANLVEVDEAMQPGAEAEESVMETAPRT